VDSIKAMFWPVVPILGMLGGIWVGRHLELPNLAISALAFLGGLGGFMLVIFTHPGRR
jgi:hypothetical protein